MKLLSGEYEYYVNELHEMDEFTGDLLKKIEESGEPTVIANLRKPHPCTRYQGVTVQEIYQTRYVWDNIGLKRRTRISRHMKRLHGYS